MEIQGHRVKSCGTSTLFTYLRILDSISYSYSPQLVNKDTNATVAQSRSRILTSIFKKPRDMGFEISEVVSHAVDVVLLTFILVWRERQNERSKNSDLTWGKTQVVPLYSLDD
jgi:hypothetical protein